MVCEPQGLNEEEGTSQQELLPSQIPRLGHCPFSESVIPDISASYGVTGTQVEESTGHRATHTRTPALQGLKEMNIQGLGYESQGRGAGTQPGHMSGPGPSST